MSIDLMKEFGLTEKQSRLMFSLEYLVTFLDAESENNENKKKQKKEWLEKWSSSVNVFLKEEKIITAKTENNSILKDLITSTYKENQNIKYPFI